MGDLGRVLAAVTVVVSAAIGAGCPAPADPCASGAPAATRLVGVCAGALKVCAAETGWADPDYMAIPGYEVVETMCDGIDNDCDGEVDEGMSVAWYLDRDGDDHGDAEVAVLACYPPEGFVEDGSDCDDAEAEAFPGNPEVCDGVDNDCDEATDEDLLITFYLDRDGDGAGDPETHVVACEAPAEYVAAAGDCDDLDGEVNADGTEVCDAVDNDCDGTTDAGPCGDHAHCAGEGASIACTCNDGFKEDGAACVVLAWTAIATGGDRQQHGTANGQACAIREGQLWCWGSNSGVPTGGGAAVSSYAPVRVGTAGDWVKVVANSGRTCGIRGAGDLYCWGLNRTVTYQGNLFAKLGLGDEYDQVDVVPAPTRVGTGSGWTDVSLGRSHGCAIREGSLYCWGRNGRGQLGLGTEERDGAYNTPTQESSAFTDWLDVEVGQHATTCAIRQEGANVHTLWCWGSGGSATPTQVGTDTDWERIVMSERGVFGIRAGALYVMGSNNQHGQFGLGDTSTSSETRQVGTDTDWQDVSSGQGNTCGIRAGKLYCWGRNANFELGLGQDLSAVGGCVEHDSRSTIHWDCLEPVLVDDTRTWTQIDVAPGFACGIAGGGLVCFGGNFYGQAGQDPVAMPLVERPTNL